MVSGGQDFGFQVCLARDMLQLNILESSMNGYPLPEKKDLHFMYVFDKSKFPATNESYIIIAVIRPFFIILKYR